MGCKGPYGILAKFYTALGKIDQIYIECPNLRLTNENLYRMNKMVITTVGMVRNQGFSMVPGFAFCLVVALASSYVSEHFGGSDIFVALLLGMAFNCVGKYEEFGSGIEVSAKKVLRIGVALLGVRISFTQIYELGFQPILLVATVVIMTIIYSVIFARLLNFNHVKGLISGASVAICGASAAMAVAAALPSNKESEKHLLCTLVGVTGLSTTAMVAYPALATKLGLNPEQIGLFLGASIHDVAHVFGAGHMVSEQVAELAVYTKMLRVTALVPVVMILAVLFRSSNGNKENKGATLPTFLVAFIILMVVANLRIVPSVAIDFMTSASKMCLLVAIAALGTRTNLIEMWQVGMKPLLLLFFNTLFIGGIAFFIISYG